MHRPVLALLLLLSALVQAEENFPCDGCPQLSQIGFPQTGFWYNPDRNGVGFNLEVQNGVLGGTFFGYDESGDPIWYLLSGSLLAVPDDPNIQWIFDAQALRFTGGPCLDCEYTPPTQQESAAQIRIEFQERNLARYQVNGGGWRTIWPLNFGSAEIFPFEGVKIPLPMLRGAWDLAFRDVPRPDPNEPRDEQNPAMHRDRYVVKAVLSDWQLSDDRTFVFASAVIPFSPLEDIGYADLACHRTTRGVECSLERSYNARGEYLIDGEVFNIPFSSFGNRRFIGETQSGATVVGYRVGYD